MTASEALEFAKIEHENLRESVSFCEIFAYTVKYRVLLIRSKISACSTIHGGVAANLSVDFEH